MKEQHLIPAQIICSNLNIELSFIDELHTMGLIQVEIIENNPFIHHNQLNELEKIIRLHNELNVNLEGIDIVFNLLQKEAELRKEINALKNRLRLYENI